MGMKAAMYARVSTKDGRQDTENQLRQLRDFAATQGWPVVHEYVDRATGKRSDREQFQKMFEGASRREFDVLLFWSLDRLSRGGNCGDAESSPAAHGLWRQLSIVHGAISR